MATGATGGNTGVVHRRTALEACCRFMTGFAGRTGDYMVSWFRFYIGKTAAVTSRTTAADAIMTHNRRHKSRCILMTSLARSRSWDMSTRFTQCFRAVMATGAA